MSKHRVAVLKVVSGQLSVTAAAAECHISRGPGCHANRLAAASHSSRPSIGIS